MHYHFKIHKEGKGYWAECIELEGCFTQADNLTELRENLIEALNSHLSEPVESDYIFPEPRNNIRMEVEAVKVKPEVAFPILLRNMRLNKKMKQHEYRKVLGFKNVYQYQRLERIGAANPSLKMISLVKEKFPDFAIEKVF